MHDFDEARRVREQRERGFLIAGREFRHRAGVAPETILRWSRARAGEIVPTEEEWLAIFDETILAILEPGQEGAWLEVRSPDAEHPVTLGDLTELLAWLFEQVTGRPTGPEPSSTRGSGSTENGSRGAGSSLEEVRSAA